MTSLYEAVRRFLEHPQDDTARADFDFQLGLYDDPPFQSSDSSNDWQPHPLSLHPPATEASQGLAQRIIQGQADLCGAKVKIEATRRQEVWDIVDKLSKDLQLDHVYCLNLIRAANAEDIRVWLEQKVGPRGGQGGGGDEYQTPGGMMAMVPLHDDLVASARYLFFIEKRAALNALLELVQARIGMGLNAAKQHAIMLATDNLISQGLPKLLMHRIEHISREINCRGRTPMEVEYEVERQKAADCLFFLFYQTQILPSELLPLPPSLTPATTSTSSLALSSSFPSSQSITLINLLKQLTEELKRKFGLVAPGEEQAKSKEERALYKTLSTLLMTLVTSLMTVDGLLPHPGGGRVGGREGGREGGRGRAEGGREGGLQRNALLILIEEEGKLSAAVDARQAYEKAYKEAQATHTTLPAPVVAALKEKENVYRDLHSHLLQTLNSLREAIEGGWANTGVHTVVLLAWHALLRDERLTEMMTYLQEGRSLGETRRALLSQAMGQGVWGFLEGGLVGCWKRPGQEDIQLFFLDCLGELVGGLLREGGIEGGVGEGGGLVRSLEAYGGGGRGGGGGGGRLGGMGRRGEEEGGRGKREHVAGQRRVVVESLVSLIARLSSSHVALAERLLWTRGGADPEPVQFVKDVTDLVKHECQLRGAWIQLLAATAGVPSEECKAATMDLLVDYSPFVSIQSGQTTDVLTYFLEDSLKRSQQNQPLQISYLLSALLLIERISCPLLARDTDLAYVQHLLPPLTSLLAFPLPAGVKGAILRSLASFVSLPAPTAAGEGGMGRQLWEHLDLLGMVPGTKGGREGAKVGLRLELEEVEAKMGTYPITEGFLTLLVALLKEEIPFDLGEGRGREGGVGPYIDYLLDDVLMPLSSRAFVDPAQKWKILCLGLTALVVVVERYPVGGKGEEDRLRSLGLDERRRMEAWGQVRRDLEGGREEGGGSGASVAFRVLLRLLGDGVGGGGALGGLLPLVLDVIAGGDLMPSTGNSNMLQQKQQRFGGLSAATLPFHHYHQSPHSFDDGTISFPPGPLMLERKGKLRDARGWDEAVRVFDEEEGEGGGGGRGGGRSGGAVGNSGEGGGEGITGGGVIRGEDEVAWQEESVKVALELLNNVLCKDLELKRLSEEVPDHPFLPEVRVLALHEIIIRGFASVTTAAAAAAAAAGGRGRRSSAAPGGGAFAASTSSSSSSSSSSLLAQGRFLPLLAEYCAYDYHPALRLHACLCLRAIMSRVVQPQDLLGMFLPPPPSPSGGCLSAEQVDRLVHFVVLDVLLKNLLPFRTTVSHLFLGYTITSQSGPLSLPSSSSFLHFGLQCLLRNLTSPSFLSLAPLLAERSSELLYRLCQSRKTQSSTLSYLQRDDIDYFTHQFTLLSRRPFPTPPPRPSSSSLSPVPPPGSEPRSSLLAHHQQQHQQQQKRQQQEATLLFLQQSVDYSSSLHIWAYLLKCLSLALFHSHHHESLKPQRLLTLLLSPSSSPPSVSSSSDFEARTLPLTSLLHFLKLAHQRDVPQPPSEEMRGIADRCSVALPGPSEVGRLFRGIVEDSFLNEVRVRLGTMGEGRGGMEGGAGEGVGGSPVAVMGGAPPLTPRFLQEASWYCLDFNHFLLRQAAEYHWCESWRRLTEAVLEESTGALHSSSFSSSSSSTSSTSSATAEALSLILTLLAHTISKLTTHPQGDIKALEHLSAVVLVAVDAIWGFAASQPAGLPLSLLSLDEGQRLLELLLHSILTAGGREGGQLAQQRFRVQGYCALVLFLRATAMWPLPEGGKEGVRERGSMMQMTDRRGRVGTEGAVLVGAALRAARQEKNAEVLTSPRYFRPLLDCLSLDAVFAPSFGVSRSKHQACAASCLGLVLDTLYAASSFPPSPSLSVGEYLPLGVMPGLGRYDTPIREVLERLPNLVGNLDPQFCVEGAGREGGRLVGRSMLMMEKEGGGEKLLQARPWDSNFRTYVALLVQAAQDVRGAKVLLERGVVDLLSRTRVLVLLENGDVPIRGGGREGGRRKEVLDENLAGVLRLLATMASRLEGNVEIGSQVEVFLRRHSRLLLQFVETRQVFLSGLEEVGVLVGLLAQTVGTKGSGVLGLGAPTPLGPVQEEYRRLVNGLFERFGVELLPPLAVRFQVRAQSQGWWAAVEDIDDHAIPCEPPRGVNPLYAWHVSDALKLLVAQSLLLHLTTYLRRRLRKARFPNVRIETVLVSLRMTLSFLAAQGDGPSPPLPSLQEVVRGGSPAVAAATIAGAADGKVPWEYDWLRTSLGRVFENLLDILYQLVNYRVELDMDFPRAAVHEELLKILQGQEEWVERQMGLGGAGGGREGGWPYLKMNLDAIQDKLRV
ncbi:nucleoporin 205-like protein [Nannochloropsis oceanica]